MEERKGNRKGDQTKEELNLPYGEVLTLADEDIDDNWEIYIFEFLKGDISMNIFEKKNADLGNTA